MSSKELLKKYHAKATRQALIKSLLSGLVYGLGALVLTSAIWWFFGMKSIWLCVLIAVVVTALVGAIYYFVVNRPTLKQTARRVDALGLEERIVTMTEFEGQESYILNKQREDTLQKLSTVNHKLLKLVVSMSLIVTLSIVGAFGIAMTTTAAVSKKSGKELIKDLMTPPPPTYVVEYVIKGDGEVLGELIQHVKRGEDASPVIAAPSADWVFVKWDDGDINPYRQDLSVRGNMKCTAIFELFGETTDDADFEDFTGEDIPVARPEESGGNKSDQDGNEIEGAGGLYEPNNNVYDGETYYGGEVFENEYGDVVDDVMGNSNLTDFEAGVILDYMDTIKK